MRRRAALDQPFLLPGTRTNSFETVSTDLEEDDYNEHTLVDYSDDEDDDDNNDDAGDEEDILRGLDFLEEERE